MSIRVFFLVIFIMASYAMQATIICPPDKNLTCHDDIHYLPLTGTPTILGGSGQLRYYDQSNTSMCNVGHIRRFWYLDTNGNEILDAFEESCVQNLYVDYIPGNISITWPANITVDCVDDIPDDGPSWVSGPCDIIGVTKRDEILKTGNDACYKILRHFTVINWCMEGQGTSQSEWKHTQMIAISDNSRPVLQQCGEVVIGAEADCKATFTVSNSAIDVSPCANQVLRWKAEVDLWNDGTIDYTYSADHIDPRFKLKNTISGEPVSFTLPELVGTGWHTVTWTVNDYCGNAIKCDQKVRVKDTKKPTPYMYEILSTAFEGKAHPINVHARQFNQGSFDNCTKSSLLRYSFSPDVNDTIRVINCNNLGFLFYYIYVTDLEGNQDYAEVYLLAFDNGACTNTRGMRGTIHESNGSPISGASMKLSRSSGNNQTLVAISDDEGVFDWDQISIYQDMVIAPEYGLDDRNRVDIADIKMLQDYLLGTVNLTNYQLVAADVDGDGAIRARDLAAMRDVILDRHGLESPWVLSSYLGTISKLADIQAFYNYKDIYFNNIKSPLIYKGVYRGDISDANDRGTSTRSQLVLTKKAHQGEMAYFVPMATHISGVQLSFSTKDIEDLAVTSAYFDIKPENIHINDDRINILVLKEMTLSPDVPLISFSMADGRGFTVKLNESSKVLLKDYRVNDLKERGVADKDAIVTLMPNPAKDFFEISKRDLKVIHIFNQTGNQVPFIQQDNRVHWEVPAGMYFVVLQDATGTMTHKLVKQ
ncbi:MAG: T9SS type A sorting domain-containing protein [Chitinophagales bacterium]|nr:T9SS type A sorting domain-containing protein [Chitinophagales bacterium]